MIIHNAFSPHYVAEITLKPETQETRLANTNTKAQREKIVFAVTANQIHITSQSDSDESCRKAGRHIRGQS